MAGPQGRVGCPNGGSSPASGVAWATGGEENHLVSLYRNHRLAVLGGEVVVGPTTTMWGECCWVWDVEGVGDLVWSVECGVWSEVETRGSS